MFFFKLPTRASSIIIGYFSLMALGIAFGVLGLSMHTGAAMMSGAMLGFFVGLYCPMVLLHITAYRNQVYRSEWLFIAVTLLPIPVWLCTMFFAHISDDYAQLVILPAATFFVAYLLPSEKHPRERSPIWHTRTRTT